MGTAPKPDPNDLLRDALPWALGYARRFVRRRGYRGFALLDVATDASVDALRRTLAEFDPNRKWERLARYAVAREVSSRVAAAVGRLAKRPAVREVDPERDEAPVATSPTDRPELTDERFRALTPDEREALFLYYLHGCTIRDGAAAAGCHPSTFRARLQRAAFRLGQKALPKRPGRLSRR